MRTRDGRALLAMIAIVGPRELLSPPRTCHLVLGRTGSAVRAQLQDGRISRHFPGLDSSSHVTTYLPGLSGGAWSSGAGRASRATGNWACRHLPGAGHGITRSQREQPAIAAACSQRDEQRRERLERIHDQLAACRCPGQQCPHSPARYPGRARWALAEFRCPLRRRRSPRPLRCTTSPA